jgi:hypothetical protein
MGVVVAVGILFIIAVTWKRANTGARIGAIIGALIFLWLAVALVNPAAAGTVAAAVPSGFSQLVNGIGHFIGVLS